MIEQIVHGDIFTTGCQALVCPVNTAGAMGKGLALMFKHRYPGLEAAYRQACRRDVFSSKGIFVWQASESKLIVCFPTKQHWSKPSRLPWIDDGLRILSHEYQHHGIRSLAMPAIGCGEGGLEWTDVYPLIVEWLDPIALRVRIYLSP